MNAPPPTDPLLDPTETPDPQAEGTVLGELLLATSDAVLLADMLGGIVHINRAFVNRLGYTASETQNRPWHLLVASPEDVPTLLRSIDEALVTQPRWQGALWVRRKNGEVFQAALTVSRWREEVGGGYILLLRDPSETREVLGRDPLTGLRGMSHVRSLLSDLLRRQRTLALSDEMIRPALLIIALERFEEVNARHGWSTADRVLQSLALRLRALIPEQQTLARIGGDRFAVIFEYVEDHSEAAAWADTLLAQIAEPFHMKGLALQLVAHVGVSVAPDTGVDAGTMLLRAEQALETARRSGQTGWRRASSRVMLTPVNGVSAPQLLRAIANDEFVVLFQPRVALKTGRVTAIETLVRWQHPDQGLLPPSTFLGQAERAGLLGELGERLLHKAANHFDVWRRDSPNTKLCITVVASQLCDETFVGALQSFLVTRNLPASALEIEVSAEIFGAEHPPQLTTSLHQISALGFSLTLSEVGRAPISITQISELSLRHMKVDAQLVRAMVQQERAKNVVGALLSMARALGINAAAAGVEDQRQVDLLRAESCDEATGYLFGRPMSAEQLSMLLRQRR